MRNSVLKLTALIVAAVLSLALVGGASAKDRVTLNDGTVVEGVIKQDLDGNIWMVINRGGVEQEVIYRAREIRKIERDVASQADDTRQQTRRGAERREQPRAANGLGAPRAAVLSLGAGGDKNMVGLYITAQSIRDAIPLLKEENIEIVVLRINSGGGALLELQKLSDVIHEELKPEFRVVAWIDDAISAAAMTAHCIEEIYFMSRGAYGACTGWRGNLEAMKGRGLEEVLYMMEKISARGGYDPAIMRAMQIQVPLSASIDEHGRVTWYQDLSGDHVVNEGNRILTFTSATAEKFGFSKGTADTIDELAKAMGLTEVVWVGEHEQGYDYPISRAERHMIRFRDTVHRDQKNFAQYVTLYMNSIGIAEGMPREDRGPFINRARNALRQMGRMVRNNPNFAIFEFNMMPDTFWNDWYPEQEERLRNLM